MSNYFFNQDIYIGNIHFEDDLLNEETIGNGIYLHNIGSASVHLYPNEGTLPHFHISVDKYHAHDICLRLEGAYYFNHGMNNNAFNAHQLKDINKFMSKPNKNNKEMTNWEYCCYLWKTKNAELQKNSNIYIKFPSKQPDYSKTKVSNNDRIEVE